MKDDYTKSPRLYIDDDLQNHEIIALSQEHLHYLIRVMRMQDGSRIRLFNGKDGEYIFQIRIISKKQVNAVRGEKIREQKVICTRVRLYCPLIKKDRFSMMIEKAVELGVSDIYPFTSDRTQISKVNIEKTKKQIIEASEQCERMDIPNLHDVQPLPSLGIVKPTYCALERQNNDVFHPASCGDIGVIIGPEGGWSDRDIEILNDTPSIIKTSLGDTILRAETAAIFMLSRIGR